MALMISYLNQFPGEKLSLSESIHTIIPFSCLILGLVEFFFFQIIINLVARIYKCFSSSRFSIEYQLGLSDKVGKRKKDVVELSERRPCLNEREREIDDGRSVGGEEVEMVMGRLGIFCHPNEDAKLQQRFGWDEFSRLFEEKEPSLDEVKGAFDVFDENRDGFIDARELQTVLSALGGLEEMDNCNRMISVFDQNGDGRIDFQEFVKLMDNSFCC